VHIEFTERIFSSPEPLARFCCSFIFKLLVRCTKREATENELQGSERAISKNASRVLKVTDFEKIFCPLISTLKLKSKIDANYTNIYIESYHMFMAFRPI
jgi:hypothetical protein